MPVVGLDHLLLMRVQRSQIQREGDSFVVYKIAFYIVKKLTDDVQKSR